MDERRIGEFQGKRFNFLLISIFVILFLEHFCCLRNKIRPKTVALI
jgi:hypothetical protein